MSENMISEKNASEALTAKQSDIDLCFAELVLKRHYAINKEVKKLHSERDQTFLVGTEYADKYIIKFTHPSEDPLVSNFQTEMMRYINEHAPEFPIQKVIPTISGDYELSLDCLGQQRTVRVVSYLEGMLMANAPQTAKQKRNLGRLGGKLTGILSGFKHPGQDHVLLWDIQHASQLRSYMSAVIAPERQAMLNFCLGNFEQRVKPRLPSLRKSIVHNDLNGDNVLVDPRYTDNVTAILDFGDSVYTAIVNDIAVGASYQLGLDETLLEGALAFIDGYTSVIPLTPSESSLMFDLILIRMFVRIVITEWRAQQFPENRKYILRNTAMSWLQLEQLLAAPVNDMRSLFQSVCKE
ncbi:hypothetical protein DDT52_00390 [Brenneria roseae subsp. roseae]|uniref:phosphotransferase n=1 Tax=Brenneria roseae TaxID=1509241 RepID=UPI000D611C46|nr:phosphotransferase [Brenneria roseae]PWC22768.1 hypothetical protein DDT52_00390 [Brenneria roseae subsp. roseae]